MRVVSLLPSATEIVCALGAEANLVGVSHECDFPESIRDRPVLTRSKIDASQSSRAIDASVRNVLRDALSVYDVDDERLAALAPDVIVTQDLCEVCAVSIEDVRSAIARRAARESIEIVSLSPTRLADVLEDIERVAEALDLVDRGRAVRAELERRIDAIAGRAAHLRERPRLVTIEWIDPLMLGGTWMPDLIELAGGVTAGAQAGQPAPTVTSQGLAELKPDVVLIKPCGFALERSLAERDVIERNVLSAVGETARVYLADGNAFFNRPGPRLVESLEILAACAHPAEFAELGTKHASSVMRLS